MSGHHKWSEIRHYKWSEIRHKAQRVTDHAERVRRSLGADGDHAALDALLAERQQAIDALWEADAHLAAFGGCGATECVGFARETLSDALVKLGEKP